MKTSKKVVDVTRGDKGEINKIRYDKGKLSGKVDLIIISTSSSYFAVTLSKSIFVPFDQRSVTLSQHASVQDQYTGTETRAR